MTVIGAEQKAGRQGCRALLPAAAQGLPDPFQHLGQEGAFGSLPGAAAHFLVIKQAEQPPGIGAGGAGQKSPQAGPGRFQVINAGAEEEPALPQQSSRLEREKGQVRIQDLLFFHPQLPGQPVRRGGGPLCRPDRLQLRSRGQRPALAVGLIKMDAEGGDHTDSALAAHQPRFQPPGRAHQDPAGQPQWPVQPGGQGKAAVAFYRQPLPAGQAAALSLFNPEGGAIAVGGAHPPGSGRLGRQPEGDQTAAVAGQVIPAPRLKGPEPPLFQLFKAGLFQPPGRARHRMEGADPLVQILKQILQLCVHLFPTFLPSGPCCRAIIAYLPSFGTDCCQKVV